MDNKELKGLSEAYNEVYLDEALPAPGKSKGAVTMYNKPRAYYAGTPRDTKFDRPTNANTGYDSRGVRTSLPQIGSLPSPRPTPRIIANRGGQAGAMQSGKPETWKLLGNSNAADVDYGRYLKARGEPQLKRDDAANARVSAEAQARARARPGAAAPASRPAAAPASRPAAAPASRPAAAPASRPASPAPRPTAATPSTAPKPSTSSTPPMSNMDKWRAANKNLATAADEKARIRGTSQTDNPLMQSFRNRLPMNSPSVQSPAVAKLGSGNQSLSQNKNAFTAAPPKPTTGIAAAVRPATPSSAAPAKVDTAASRLSTVSKPAIASIENQSGAKPFDTSKLPSSQTKMKKESYDFGKPDRITQDVASLYQSIYEAKKKVDQDQDGDNDFADVQIAKMIASGMSKEEAIRKVRNKSYNEETELDEGRTEELKRKYTAKYGKLEYPTDTLRLNKTRRAYEKASRDNQDGYGKNPRTAIKGKQNLGQAMYKAGQSARVINAEFELWVNELLDEGYDLSDYTWDELYEGYQELDKKADSYDAYNLVIEHLIDEGYADNCDSADMMMERMSDEWLNEILESKYWIQKAIKKPGALHKELGVPMGKKIPAKKLTAAAKSGGKMGRRARLAKTLSKFN